MGLLDDLEAKGQELLQNIVQDAQSGGIEGIQKMASVDGLEAEVNKTFNSGQAVAATTSDSSDSDTSDSDSSSDDSSN